MNNPSPVQNETRVESSAEGNETRVPAGPPPRKKGLVSTLRYGYAFFTDPVGFVGNRFAQYGDIYYAPSGGIGLYVVKDPDHVRDVLITNADDFAKQHTAFESLSEVLGEGLLTTDGDVWKRHRRLLAPAFGKKAIEGYAEGMVRETETTLNRLCNGKPVDIANEMTDLTLRIVGRTLMGIDVSGDVGRIAGAMASFQTALAIPRGLPRLVRAPFQERSRRARAELDAMILRVIEERRQSGIRGSDLLQMLLDSSDPENPSDKLSAKEIQDELVTFLLAGHETTSNTLTWALYLLSQHPEVEKELRKELSAVLGNRLPTGADVDQLLLATRIIKESMRLYPPAYALARRAARDTKIGPYKVPRRSEVVIWTYFTHRDPRYYPDPEQFRPERFEPEAEASRPRHAYLPFGLGPRACIGRSFAQVEATILLASLMQRFTFRYTAKSPPRIRTRITLTPAGGLILVPQAIPLA